MKFKIEYKTLLNGAWTEPMTATLEASTPAHASLHFARVHEACFGPEQKYQILSIDNLSPISADWAIYQIAEDEQFQMYLTQKETGCVLHLYEVTQLGFKVCVLSPTEQGALSQAQCHDNWSADLDTSVERVPLMLRGWSGRTF